MRTLFYTITLLLLSCASAVSQTNEVPLADLSSSESLTILNDKLRQLNSRMEEVSTQTTSLTNVSGVLAVANGGTGQSTAINLGELLPDQTGHSGEFLTTDGSVYSWGAGSTSVQFTSSGTWTAPSGVSHVFISAVGGGGGGGGGSGGTSQSGGGGGSGAFIDRVMVDVTPGNSYSVTVGDGGTGGTSTVDGNNGTASSFVADNVTVSVNGGSGGKSYIVGTGGAGGTSSGTGYDVSGTTPGSVGTSTAGGDGGIS